MEKVQVLFGPYVGGLLSGVVGYTIRLDDSSFSDDELVDIAFVIRSHPGCSKHKIVTVSMLGTNYMDSSVMYSLLKPLRDAGFRVIIESDGQRYYSFFNLANGLRVRLKQPKWTPFECSELWYTPLGLIEPEVIDEKVPMLYLESDNTETIRKFLLGARRSWNVILPGTASYEEELLVINYDGDIAVEKGE